MIYTNRLSVWGGGVYILVYLPISCIHVNLSIIEASYMDDVCNVTCRVVGAGDYQLCGFGAAGEGTKR